MVALLLTGLLFLFLALSIGFFINRKLVGSSNSTVPLFEILLSGTTGITVYLNILSIFLPSDYWLLIPLMIISTVILFTTSFYRDVTSKCRHVLSILFFKKNLVVTVPFFIVIVAFIFVPPFNTDMGGYHILAILWNEKFRAVPGLANLFAQFGFNSSFFVLSAGFSFTDIFKQSIYPVNIVLIIAFYGWMLLRSFSYNDWRKPLIWLLLIFFFRQFLINISAPSPDALFMMLVFYILFKLMEERRDVWSEGNHITLALFAIFAIVIKISAFPLLLVAFSPLLYQTSGKQKVKWFSRLAVFAVIIIVPWLIRNVVISGYLLFPVPVDFFNVDWKVPMNLLMEEKQHVSNAPRMISNDFAYVDHLPLYKKFILWLPGLWLDSRINFCLIGLAFLSPALAWFACKKISVTNQQLWVWSIAYAGVMFWFIGSPDIRFGFPYLVSSLCIPLMVFASQRKINHQNFIIPAFAFIVILGCGYYVYNAAVRLSPYKFSDWLVRPLKHPEYNKNNDMKSFRFVELENNTKVYIHDSSHHTINAPLPSCAPCREGLQMRGNSVDDGFRMAK